MNLAYKYPIIFWNCACLISDAGGNEEEEIDEEAIEEDKVEEEYIEEMEWFDDDEDMEVSSYDEDDGENGWPAQIIVTETGKKKKKVKATNYGKVASAIGKIKSAGVEIIAPDINRSTYTFSPDVDKNIIRYGLSGITRIGNDLIKNIMLNRPYSGIDDFLNKVKVNKPQMINLIKSGAFDEFGDRIDIMKKYVAEISDTKKRVTLQNMKMLIDFNLIPDEYELERKVFNFNKYVKKFKDGIYYDFDNIAFNFYNNNFDIDILEPADTESGFKIKQTQWDKIYKHHMDKVRPFIKNNHDDLLNKMNEKLMSDVWNKYCLGSISKWEMDSISCYIHEHELARIVPEEYGYTRFEKLGDTPRIEKYLPIKSKNIPIFKLERIMGTVLDRNKAKKTITLLTIGGVVTVKVYGTFAFYDRQLSERGADGKKHVIRKSDFSRGNKIVVSGIRQGDDFIAKKYSRTPWHTISVIKEIDSYGNLVFDNRESVE